MIKRLISIVLTICTCVSLFSCNNSLSGNGTKQSSTSKLKGEYVFYEKGGDLYYKNCENDEEVLALKNYESNLDGWGEYSIYLDEKRKQVIFGDSKSGYIYKKTLNDSKQEAIKICNASCIVNIINNRYLICKPSYTSGGYIYVYDLDKEMLNEVAMNGDIHSYDDENIYYSAYNNNGKRFPGSYNFLTNKNTEIKLVEEEGNVGKFRFSRDTIYYTVTNIDYNNEKLYKIKNGQKSELIDEIQFEWEYLYPENSDKKIHTYFDLPVDGGADGSIYYHKGIGFDGYFETSDGKKCIREIHESYYYDGKNRIPINNISIKSVGNNIQLADIEDKNDSTYDKYYCKDKIKDGYIRKDKYRYQGINGTDGTYYIKAKRTNNQTFELYKASINNDDEILLNDGFNSSYGWYCLYIDKDKTLYMVSNNLYLNNDKIGTEIKDNGLWDFTNYVSFNKDLSIILFTNNLGINLYDGNGTKTISSEGINGFITNKNNIIYQKEKSIHYYKNGESNKILDDVDYIQEYGIIR